LPDQVRWPRSPFPGTFDAFAQSALIEWLEKVIERVHFKCLDRVVVVGRHKDYRRHPLRSYFPDDIETGAIGQLNVEQNEVELGGSEGSDAFCNAAALTGDFYRSHSGKVFPYTDPYQGLVVNDQQF
jgi:hypothetical protein